MPDHVMRHPWSTSGHPLKAHQAAPNHVRWGIWDALTHCKALNLVEDRRMHGKGETGFRERSGQ